MLASMGVPGAQRVCFAVERPRQFILNYNYIELQNGFRIDGVCRSRFSTVPFANGPKRTMGQY